MISERLAPLLARIDRLNSEDPNTELIAGATAPRELVYAKRLTEWVFRLNPDASEPLQIAARGQHIRRWTLPRQRYPMSRQGYLKWRETLKAFHADTVARLMEEAGYSDAMIQRVRVLMSKRHLADDPETQTLEDALCLVFLQYQFADLHKKTPPDKMLQVLQKTWTKMSPQARQLALGLPLGSEERALVTRAIST